MVPTGMHRAMRVVHDIEAEDAVHRVVELAALMGGTGRGRGCERVTALAHVFGVLGWRLEVPPWEKRQAHGAAGQAPRASQRDEMGLGMQNLQE